MQKSIVLIILVFSTTLQIYAWGETLHETSQKAMVRGLVITKPNNKTVLLKENKKIRVWVNHEKKPIKGRYQIINDTLISIYDQEIPLSEITRLSTSGPMVYLGMGATVLGAGAIYFGSALLVYAQGGTGYGHGDIRYFLPFVPPVTFLYFTNKNRFPLMTKEIGEKVTLSIITNN
ncbi:MAG: hypothetical protein ACFHWX_09165 [Bacteroidota bacterium]